jgi:hypothetical protein
MKIEQRPTEMLERQLLANRKAARQRLDKYGRKTFQHIMPYRPHFVRDILAMRAELRRRNAAPQVPVTARPGPNAEVDSPPSKGLESAPSEVFSPVVAAPSLRCERSEGG